MITCCIQIGNSDDKLRQSEWSHYVEAMRGELCGIAIQVYFFGCSEGCKPWQNACWVVSIQDADLDYMFAAIKRTREAYQQDSVAVVLGDVTMV